MHPPTLARAANSIATSRRARDLPAGLPLQSSEPRFRSIPATHATGFVIANAPFDTPTFAKVENRFWKLEVAVGLV